MDLNDHIFSEGDAESFALRRWPDEAERENFKQLFGQYMTTHTIQPPDRTGPDGRHRLQTLCALRISNPDIWLQVLPYEVHAPERRAVPGACDQTVEPQRGSVSPITERLGSGPVARRLSSRKGLRSRPVRRRSRKPSHSVWGGPIGVGHRRIPHPSK